MDRADVQFSESSPSYWLPDVGIEQQQVNEHQPDGQSSQTAEMKTDPSLLQQQSQMQFAQSHIFSSDQQSQEQQQQQQQIPYQLIGNIQNSQEATMNLFEVAHDDNNESNEQAPQLSEEQFQNPNECPASIDIGLPKLEQKENCSSDDIQAGPPQLGMASLLSTAYEAADAALREIDNDMMNENFGITASSDFPFDDEYNEKSDRPGHVVESLWATEGRDEELKLPEQRAERIAQDDAVEREDVQQVNHSLEDVLRTDQEQAFEKQHIPRLSEEEFEAKNEMIGRKFPIPTQNILEEIVYFQESAPLSNTHPEYQQASTPEDATELEELSFRPAEKIDETRIQQECVQKNIVCVNTSKPIFGVNAIEICQQTNGIEKLRSDEKFENSETNVVQRESKDHEITEAIETDFKTKGDGTPIVFNENRLVEVEQNIKMQKNQQAEADIESNIAIRHSETSCVSESIENHRMREEGHSNNELQNSAAVDEKFPLNKPTVSGQPTEISSNPKYTNGSTGLNLGEETTQQVGVKQSTTSASSKVTNGTTAKNSPNNVDGALKKLQPPAVPSKPTKLTNPGMKDKPIPSTKRITTSSKSVNVKPKKSESNAQNPAKKESSEKLSIPTDVPKKPSSDVKTSLRAPLASRSTPVNKNTRPTKQQSEASSSRANDKLSAPSKAVKTISATAGKSGLLVEKSKPKPAKAVAKESPTVSQANFSQKTSEVINKTAVEKHKEIAVATDSKLESDGTIEPVVRRQIQQSVLARDPIVWVETLVPTMETIFTYGDNDKLVNGTKELSTVDDVSVPNEMNQEYVTERKENFNGNEESNGRISYDQPLIETTEAVHPLEMIPTSSMPSKIIEKPELTIPPTSMYDASENVASNSVPEEPTSSVQLTEKNIDVIGIDTKYVPDFITPIETESEISSDARPPVDESLISLPVHQPIPAEVPSYLLEPSTIPDIGTGESEKPDEPSNRVSELLKTVITETEVPDHLPIETDADLIVDHSRNDTMPKELTVQLPEQVVQSDGHKDDAVRGIHPHYDANVGITSAADYAAEQMPDEAINASQELAAKNISSSESSDQPRSKLQGIVISSIVPPDPDHVQQQKELQERREQACGNGQADESQKQSLSGTTKPQKPRQHGRGQFRGMVVDSMTSEQDNWYQSRSGERQNGSTKQKQYYSNEGGDHNNNGGAQGQSQQQQHQRKSKRKSKKPGKSHRGGYRAE